jgi:excisionase family DNA binding protein
MQSTKSLSIPQEKPAPPPDKICNAKEAALLLGCTERTVLDLFKKGEIKATKRTGKYLTVYQNIVDFINR